MQKTILCHSIKKLGLDKINNEYKIYKFCNQIDKDHIIQCHSQYLEYHFKLMLHRITNGFLVFTGCASKMLFKTTF